MNENRVTVLDSDDAPLEPRHPRGTGLLATGIVVLAVASLAAFGSSGRSDSPAEAQPEQAATTTTSATTSTTLNPAATAALAFEADVELIDQLWLDETTAWTGGFDSGLQFWVDNNYPDMGCSVGDYMAARFTDGRVEGLQIARLAHPPTIMLDDGWIIPGGRLAGVPARGRVYAMDVTDSLSAPGYPTSPPSTRNIHVTILDGRAHFFFGCPA